MLDNSLNTELDSELLFLVGRKIPEPCASEPFSLEALEFLNEVSAALRGHPQAKNFSDLHSFAFWCRKAHLEKEREQFLKRGERRLGRGLALHIAPANVPLNFAFSFAWGLLSGNANVVRLSKKVFPQSEVFCAILAEVFKKFPKLASQNVFVRYDSKSHWSARFSAICDLRLIWGGDRTIHEFKQLPSPPRCVDLVFSDRRSLALLNSDSVLSLSTVDLERLAHHFFNDSFLMDQNACSSPHLVCWLGSRVSEAQRLFWGELRKVVEKSYSLEPTQAVEKLARACKDAITLEAPFMEEGGNLIYRFQLKTLPQRIDKYQGQSGIFYEYTLKTLEELKPHLNSRFQTLIYFGVERQNFDAFLKSQPALDRIVPIGRALDMGFVWDGYDVIASASRIIDLQ